MATVAVMTVPSAASVYLVMVLLPTSPTYSVFSSSDSTMPFGRLPCVGFIAALTVPLGEIR